jgi:hypothetical protein
MSLTNLGSPLVTHGGVAVHSVDADVDGDAWDAALLDLGGGAPFATSAWAPVLRDYFGVAPIYLLARTEERTEGWDGCLACYVNRDWTGQLRLYGARQGMFATRQAADGLVAAAGHLAGVHGCPDFDLSSTDPVLENRPGYRARTTFRLALDRDHDVMWRQLRDKTRNMVRRAQKSDVTVRELPHDDTSFRILSAHNEGNLLPKGVAVPDSKYFAAVCASHGACAHILSAWLGDVPIASMLVLRHGGMAVYPVQNADPAHRRLAPIQLLTWEAMCLGAANGCEALDMGESGEGSPVYKAKRNFGGSPKMVSSLSARIDGDASPGSGAFGARIRSVLDSATMQHAPMLLRRKYGRRRFRRGRIL